jgi:hypothetical protein
MSIRLSASESAAFTKRFLTLRGLSREAQESLNQGEHASPYRKAKIQLYGEDFGPLDYPPGSQPPTASLARPSCR